MKEKKNIEVQIAIVQGRFNHWTVADREYLSQLLSEQESADSTVTAYFFLLQSWKPEHLYH